MRSDDKSQSAECRFGVRKGICSAPSIWLILALLGPLALGLFVDPAFGAGVTIITHGFEFDNSYPAWVDDMGAAVSARAGLGTTVYNFGVGYLQNGSFGGYFNYERGPYSPGDSTNAEIVIKVFWYKVAGITDTITATDVANVVAPVLLESNVIPQLGKAIRRPLAELPIHLIGHSRGASVISEIARRLAEHGVWVDHLTALDSHPLGDAEVQVFDNVAFADNYWQTDTGIAPISGEPIYGSANEDLTPLFNADGISDLFNWSDHTETHDWYYGTIDLLAATASGDPIPRAIWYPVNYQRGFQTSRIANGQRLREAPQLQIGYAGIGWKWSTNAFRSTNYVISGTQWPSVFLENTNDLWTARVGETMNFQVRYAHNSSNYVTVELGTDNDRNPYNQSPGRAFLITTNAITTHAKWWTGVRAWRPTLADDGKYVYAKVSDLSGLFRYYYLGRPFRVVSSPPPHLDPVVRFANGFAEITASGVVGLSYTFEASADLVTWVSLTNYVSTTSTMLFADPTSAGLDHRFYRIVVP